jgi:hypothetical protein
MEPQLSENHPSYKNHRRQFWLQIFLPTILAVLLIIVVAVITSVSAFGQGDSPRWAAISTIWLVIPVMFFGLAVLALLLGLVYLLARTLNVLPPYSSQAQHYVNRGASEAKRFLDMAAEPVMSIEGLKASIKAIFGRN